MKLRLPPIPTPHEILQLYGISTNKSLSRHFILNETILTKLINPLNALVNGGCGWDIGAGPGATTAALIGHGARHVIAVEEELRFIPFLKRLRSASSGRCKLTIAKSDALQYEFERVSFSPNLIKSWSDEQPKIFLCAHLPFRKSIRLLINMLKFCQQQSGPFQFGRITLGFILQKEVCERICASEGHHNRLSVQTQAFFDVDYPILVENKNFFPQPKPHAGYLILTPRVEPLLHVPYKFSEKLIKHVFHLRNKQISNSLKSLFPPKQDVELTKELITAAGLYESLPGSSLTIANFNSLSNVYFEMCSKLPGLFEFDVRSKRRFKWKDFQFEGELYLKESDYTYLEKIM